MGEWQSRGGDSRSGKGTHADIGKPVDFLRLMSDFLLFTQTQWSEAPRIRHQAARMLLDAGHRVFFFERPAYPWAPVRPSVQEVEPRLFMVQTVRFMHHQLRACAPLHWLNAWVTSTSIRRRLRELPVQKGAVVINFAHDYYFLRRVFPGSRIITIIHDDFEAQARLPFSSHITWSLKRTCEMSDEVYAVSTPLQERCSAWCKAKLLLPWSVIPYVAPRPGVQGRDTLLFWGYVDSALDLDLLRRLSAHLLQMHPGWRILLVGPTQGNGRQPVIDGLTGCSNIAIQERTALDDLPLDRTLAALLPYRRSKAVDSVTLANKSMQLLARGLPLLISGMPAYIQRPFIRRVDAPDGPEPALQACLQNFDAWQPAIADFVRENAPESRMALLGFERA